jgi:hypothetical protein
MSLPDYNKSKNPTTGLEETHCSFSGSDIQCYIFGDELQLQGDKDWVKKSQNFHADEKKLLENDIVRSGKERLVTVLNGIQTITVSSARSFGPVRRLGEIEPVVYKGGARTIAGSMVFALMNEDVFVQLYSGLADGMGDNIGEGPDFVDAMPPFNILIRAYNEYGAQASAMLMGVKITNFGTTYSVDDMFTESTYNYVAKHYIPFVSDWKTAVQKYIAQIISNANPLSQMTDPRPPVSVSNFDYHDIYNASEIDLANSQSLSHDELIKLATKLKNNKW